MWFIGRSIIVGNWSGPRVAVKPRVYYSAVSMDESIAPRRAEHLAGQPAEQVAPLSDTLPTADPYLAALGARVRSMRAVRGMSRKVLARQSGVSERYIAQLESGLGNLSIILLRRVAAAIGVPIEDLVADDAKMPRELALIRERLRTASPSVLAQVRVALDRSNGPLPAEPVRDRIALVGLRGAGKSTLGRMAAERLGWPFVELNREIERESGLAVAEVFSLYGQDGYRRLEQAALERVAGRAGPVILATGGGIVAHPVTYERLLSAFHTIWIRAEPAQHMSRVRAQGDTRPMGTDRAAMAELETILASRTGLYGRARDSVDTSVGGLEASLERLLAAIGAQARPLDD